MGIEPCIMQPLEMSRPSSNYSPGTEQTSMHETKGGKRHCTSLSIKDTWVLSRCYSTWTFGLVFRYSIFLSFWKYECNTKMAFFVYHVLPKMKVLPTKCVLCRKRKSTPPPFSRDIHTTAAGVGGDYQPSTTTASSSSTSSSASAESSF